MNQSGNYSDYGHREYATPVVELYPIVMEGQLLGQSKEDPSKASGTYYYTMGENDYASGNQNTALAEKTNYLVAAYETWTIDPYYQREPKNRLFYPKEEGSYCYILNSNKFKTFTNPGEIARNKVFLCLPSDVLDGATYSSAKLNLVEADSQTTGIGSVEQQESTQMYNLSG